MVVEAEVVDAAGKYVCRRFAERKIEIQAKTGPEQARMTLGVAVLAVDQRKVGGWTHSAQRKE